MSKIEWTETTWNPVSGCTRVSEGCDNCYAVTMTRRLEAMGLEKYSGLVNEGKKHFNGKVKIHYDELEKPYKWKKPRKIFVNSMSDLFHDEVGDQFIIEVMHVIAKNPQHIFQVLTKRPDRAREFFTDCAINPYWGDDIPDNLWLGTSVENQKAADQRIPELIQIPAKVKFLSCEPLLGPIDFSNVTNRLGKKALNGIDWIIAGGESGTKARPMHPDWARSIRDQCQIVGVPFFFKQWGEWVPFEDTAQPPFVRACNTCSEYDSHGMNYIDPITSEAGSFKGCKWMDAMDSYTYCADTNDKPVQFLKTGKSKAGRLLDGKLHDEYPQHPLSKISSQNYGDDGIGLTKDEIDKLI